MGLSIYGLPAEYKGKRVTKRMPYTMPGDLQVNPQAGPVLFSAGQFLHNVDFVFEATKFVPNVTALDGSFIPIADPNIGSLFRWVLMQIKVIGLEQVINKSPQRLSSLLDKDTFEWAFEAPIYIEKSQGFDVAVTNQIPSASAAGGIRFEAAFIGSLLILE
jgi:hypothetical protein